METKAFYSSIESFALVDGPGVRSVLFLSGCPLRCLYCHNPETWAREETKIITVSEAINRFSRFASYWRNNGGITVSGGEPLLQMDFLIEFFTEAKKRGYSTCIDTAGSPFTREEPFFSKFNELLKVTDLMLLDIKAPNDHLHEIITGKKGDNIRDMFSYLDEKNFPIWIRYVLVPGYTDSDEVLHEARAFLDTLHNVKRTEVLPYHPFAMPKYQELGLEYKLKDTNIPTKESVAHAEEILGVTK